MSVTFNQFITEARKAQLASKRGRVSKPGNRSGVKETPKNIMMTGAPGSGKSTLAKGIATKTGGTRYGYDDARRDIHGDHTNQGDFPKVHKRTMDTLKSAPKDKPRIQDNTNVNPRFREKTKTDLRTSADFDEPITSVMPNTSRRAAFRRNRARGEKQVPRHIMRAMWNQHDRFKKTKEGRAAVQQGKELSKDLRIPSRQRRFRRRTSK